MKNLSIYIHYPFCLSKCPYCDFNSYKKANIDEERFLKAYLLELEYYYKITKNYKINTIFFGGGTPSIMSIDFLSKILKKIDNCWGIDKKIEITIEANPTTFEINKFKDFYNLGINRLSIGIQSLNDEDLKFFGRIHNRIEALNAIDIAQKVFGDRYSIDLIYARPRQKINDWLLELEEATKLSPNHISLYQLIIEVGTQFYKNRVEALDEENSAEMYKITNDFLNDKNICMYEVSNYSKKGFECKHNLNYWNSGEWIGIGAGAHGRLCHHWTGDYNSRFAIQNFDNVVMWQEAVFNEGVGIEEKLLLTKQEFIEEILLMGLRMKQGININNITPYLKINKIEDLLNKNYKNFLDYININNDNLSIKENYFNILDSIILKLF